MLKEPDDEAQPLTTWAVPGMDPGSMQLVPARAGETTVVVGANGAGKSALGLWMQLNNGGVPIRRLIAHRRLWFSSAGPDISPAQREATAGTIENWSRSPDSRYLDHADSQRAGIILFDILALISTQNARIADLALAGADVPQIQNAEGPRVLDRLNAILDESGLLVQLKLTDRQTFTAVNARRGAEYPIFQMSDGEKSAVLLASEVLAAAPGAILIIDEPERHLHRSISSGLIEAIVASRPDCHFVVLTHDLELASTLSEVKGHAFVLTECIWAAQSAVSWALFALDPSEGMPDATRAAILGGRRDLLFVEGDIDSLDVKLYGILFPHWTVTPCGGADQVIRAVAGLQASQQHHWVRARGIVDGDGRTAEERRTYISRGVLSLPVSEIESLYYLPVVVNSLAEAQAANLGHDASSLFDDAKVAALQALRSSGTFDRLASNLALIEVRRRLAEQLPTNLGPSAAPIELSIPSPFERIRSTVRTLSDADDLDGLIRLLPIRDTPLRSQVAAALGFRSHNDYEAAVRAKLRSDSSLRSSLQEIVGPIPVGA